MAITATTTFDLVGGTQTIIFDNPTLIDQITYTSDNFTFSAISGFTLTKEDFILYSQYLIAYFSLFNLNFPGVNFQSSFPVSQFEVSVTNVGVEKISYIQSSLSNSVYTINYLPSISSAGFASRSSVTITPQEFYMLILMFQQYTNQISKN